MWYDVFSLFYDRALEDLYVPFRPAAVEALRLAEGASVLDLPCGTGQSFALLASAVGPAGSVLGVDASGGMLRRARRRVERAGWHHVAVQRAAAADVDAGLLAGALGTPEVDGVLCALGLTALPEWEAAFERLFSLLRPGGRFVLFDVYAAERTREARSVELVARADLSREAWRPLAARCRDFSRQVLPADAATFGGELWPRAPERRPDPRLPPPARPPVFRSRVGDCSSHRARRTLVHAGAERPHGVQFPPIRWPRPCFLPTFALPPGAACCAGSPR